MCRFIVWYQVWRPIIRLYTLPSGHWTCSFVCHFNFTESIQFCSHFGALNLLYTLPSLSYQVLIFFWVTWSIWGWSALPKDTTLKQCPKIERGETLYFSENPAPSGIRNRTAGSDIDRAWSNHCAMLALPASFEYLCYGSTTTRHILLLSMRGPSLYVRRLKTVPVRK